jgi:hypothetical protein
MASSARKAWEKEVLREEITSISEALRRAGYEVLSDGPSGRPEHLFVISHGRELVEFDVTPSGIEIEDEWEPGLGRKLLRGLGVPLRRHTYSVYGPDWVTRLGSIEVPTPANDEDIFEALKQAGYVDRKLDLQKDIITEGGPEEIGFYLYVGPNDEAEPLCEVSLRR